MSLGLFLQKIAASHFFMKYSLDALLLLEGDASSNPESLPILTLDASPAAVSEDGTANLIYTFTRSGNTSSSLSVNYTVGGSATIGSDYTGISTAETTQTITFAAGSATAALVINPTADTITEPDETVSITLAPSTGYTSGTTAAVVGNINNDDIITGLPPGSFREDFNGSTLDTSAWQVATWREHGGQTGVERTFVRDGYLNMVLVNDPARGILNSSINTWQEFGLGKWEARLKPTAVRGVLNSFFTIDWERLSTPGVPADGTKQEIDIEFLTSSFGSNSGEVHYAVHADGRQSMNTNPDISLGFNPSDDFHVYGFDIKRDRIDWLVDGRITHTYQYAGNDITIDSPYQLKLNTWTASDWIGGPPTSGVESIYQIDWVQFTPDGNIAPSLPSITLGLASTSVAEDGTANLVYTFTRSGSTSAALSVNYSVGGTATLGSDYSGISTAGTTKAVTFAAGSATASVTVDPTADTTVETNETVALTLAAGSGYTIGTAGAVIGTITNDDVATAPLPSITLALASTSVAEDGTANLVYTFTRSGSTSAALSVNYSVGGTATLGSDYSGISTAGTTKAVTFAAGSATASVTVDPTADTTVETNETVALTLAAGSGYTIGTAGAVTGAITNDDVATAPLPSITLGLASASVAEDGTANLVYTFTRSGSTSAALSVNYSVGGTATLGSDYSGISTAGTTKAVTFAAGSATASVTVDPTADTIVETNETVALTLAAGSGYGVGTTGAVTGTIRNDDIDPITGLRKGWELTASNTGLAAYGIIGSQLPVYTGPSKIPAGSRISGVRFTSPVDLSNGDIIIEKSLFQPTWAGAGLPLVTTVDFNQFRPVPSKVIIRDCEIDGSLVTSNRSDFSDQRFRASLSGFEGVADLQRNYIHNVGSGIALRQTGTQLDSLIEGNYVDNLVAWGDAGTTGSHNNGISIRDFTAAQRPDRKAIIRNNRFELDTPGNASSSIQVLTYDGRVDNVRIEGNLLEGYGYNLWLEWRNYGFSNMSAIDNRFSTWSAGYGPQFNEAPGWSAWQSNSVYNPSMPNAMGAPISL